MSVAGIAIEAAKRTPIVLLRDPSGRRQVPIWIDQAQAHNILVGIQESHRERPLTHDLMVSLIEIGNLKLKRVIIYSLKDNTFKATLKINIKNLESKKEANKKEKEIEIDARPSDAIALAVRTKCSIWMLEEVVASASIPVDAEADELDKYEFKRFIEKVSPSSLISHLKERGSKNNDLQD